MDELSDIQFERGSGRGRYWLTIGDGEPAELTFVESGAGHIVIDHTYVPRQYRGRGVAFKLLAKAVDDARAEGTKITPLCSYAAAEFRNRPEWADLLKRSAG